MHLAGRRRPRALLAAIAFGFAAAGAAAQDTQSWLESQGLQASESKSFQEFEALVVRPKGAPPGTDEHVVVLRQGRPVWTSPKENGAALRWTVHSIGRDLDGERQPDVHLSSFTGRTHCCTTHYVLRLKPQVRKVASYAAGNVGGGEFLDIPGRKAPVMISADDSSANAFAPYANSYFPAMILEVSPRGRFEFARDLMQTKLPGQPPPVCSVPAATANAWLRERCGEYTTMRRQERTAYIKERLAAVKATRSSDTLKWEDYYANGVLAAISAEMNRYAYTGHGEAAYNWLETVWPGNDEVKVRFINTLRKTQASSGFAQDLKALAADHR